MEEAIIVDLQVDDSEAVELKASSDLDVRKEARLAAAPSDPLAGSRFVEPVSLVVSITLSVLAKRMVDTWLKSKEEGVLVDTRKDPIVVSRVAGVPAGFMVLIDQEGKSQTIQADYKDNENLTSLLAKFLGPAKV